jgi:hypothetical protein
MYREGSYLQATVKNPVREHGASSKEKAIYIWGLIAPKTT